MSGRVGRGRKVTCGKRAQLQGWPLCAAESEQCHGWRYGNHGIIYGLYAFIYRLYVLYMGYGVMENRRVLSRVWTSDNLRYTNQVTFLIGCLLVV